MSKVEKESGRDGKGKWVGWKINVGEMGKNVGWIEKESITRAFAHE
ncbi:hypothetical protein KZO38_04860 [Prevotella nanceiensis]|uniref:Uncharacterized protein n=1 Tax=Hoylesella nanceiensis TaxID=425941 RepID=A0ABS6YC04_9BACT|nr:hypothetical protein [Hoylesella nanceiensis]